MTVTVSYNKKNNESVKVSAPPSKSIAHRLLILAALSDKPTEIFCRGTSDDIDRTTECLNSMGAEIRRTENSDIISVVPIAKP